MELKEYGRIRRMTLPESWQQDPPRNDGKDIISFRAAEKSELKLSFYNRGRPLPNGLAQDLHAVLKPEPHILDDAEFESIEVIIGDACEPEYFDLKEARTQSINSVRVLLIEGHWLLSDRDCMGVFIDRNGDGKEIDEIYFLAPKTDYQQYLPLFKDALNSIEWT